MTQTHTPGPWTTTDGMYSDVIEIWNLHNGTKAFLVADVPNDSPDEQDQALQMANARLIAKAPELLNALRDVVTPLLRGWNVDDMDVRLETARALLAEIEGTHATTK